ncbi:unnamed protein product [Closterium sp. NIES-54]
MSESQPLDHWDKRASAASAASAAGAAGAANAAGAASAASATGAAGAAGAVQFWLGIAGGQQVAYLRASSPTIFAIHVDEEGEDGAVGAGVGRGGKHQKVAVTGAGHCWHLSGEPQCWHLRWLVSCGEEGEEGTVGNLALEWARQQQKVAVTGAGQ